jgi:hypothetical protein
MVPRQVSTIFTGRQQILETLQEKLCDQDSDMRRKPKTFVIYGIGGSGKSEVSLKFAEENKEK